MEKHICHQPLASMCVHTSSTCIFCKHTCNVWEVKHRKWIFISLCYTSIENKEADIQNFFGNQSLFWRVTLWREFPITQRKSELYPQEACAEDKEWFANMEKGQFVSAYFVCKPYVMLVEAVTSRGLSSLPTKFICLVTHKDSSNFIKLSIMTVSWTCFLWQKKKTIWKWLLMSSELTVTL